MAVFVFFYRWLLIGFFLGQLGLQSRFFLRLYAKCYDPCKSSFFKTFQVPQTKCIKKNIYKIFLKNICKPAVRTLSSMLLSCIVILGPHQATQTSQIKIICSVSTTSCSFLGHPSDLKRLMTNILLKAFSQILSVFVRVFFF